MRNSLPLAKGVLVVSIQQNFDRKFYIIDNQDKDNPLYLSSRLKWSDYEGIFKEKVNNFYFDAFERAVLTLKQEQNLHDESATIEVERNVVTRGFFVVFRHKSLKPLWLTEDFEWVDQWELDIDPKSIVFEHYGDAASLLKRWRSRKDALLKYGKLKGS
jgi:hypothetical protein